MNIFYLDKDPVLCAQMHNDSHSSKMCVEYAQLLSTAHRILDGFLWRGTTSTGRSVKRFFHPDEQLNANLYLACHINHPSAIWVRHSAENYNWLYSLWLALGNEYTHRYNRKHESLRKLSDYLLLPPNNINTGKFTEPPPAMKQFPDCIVSEDSIQSYRNYYMKAKESLGKWTNRKQPEWWVLNENS